MRNTRFLLRVVLAVVASLVVGCAHSNRGGDHGGVPAVPAMPDFLCGPMGLLLTNTDGFTARAVIEFRSASGSEMMAGQLAGRKSQLRFLPETGEAAEKRWGKGGISFLWDAGQSRGCVLCEALQGYALVAGKGQYTNVSVQPATNQASPERIDGHACSCELVVVTASDGATTSLAVWRATDLRQLPLRLASSNGADAVTVSLAKVRLEPLPAQALEPPADFTKYADTDTMMSELATRQQPFRRKTMDRPAEDNRMQEPDRFRHQQTHY